MTNGRMAVSWAATGSSGRASMFSPLLWAVCAMWSALRPAAAERPEPGRGSTGGAVRPLGGACPPGRQGECAHGCAHRGHRSEEAATADGLTFRWRHGTSFGGASAVLSHRPRASSPAWQRRERARHRGGNEGGRTFVETVVRRWASAARRRANRAGRDLGPQSAETGETSVRRTGPTGRSAPRRQARRAPAAAPRSRRSGR